MGKTEQNIWTNPLQLSNNGVRPIFFYGSGEIFSIFPCGILYMKTILKISYDCKKLLINMTQSIYSHWDDWDCLQVQEIATICLLPPLISNMRGLVWISKFKIFIGGDLALLFTWKPRFRHVSECLIAIPKL